MTAIQSPFSRSHSPHITIDPLTASQWLKQGKLLAYPTESVWGIGCDATNEQAVFQVLTIKQRDSNKGLIVLTDSIQRLAPLLATLTNEQRQKIEQSWQAQTLQAPHQHSQLQATTWLLPLNDAVAVPSWITGQHRSVAIRVTIHPLIQQLCQYMVSKKNPFGFIISTSCNPSGQIPAKTLAESVRYFGDDIGYLQGDTVGYQQPSQIKDAITGQVIR